MAALTRIRAEPAQDSGRSLVAACSEGDIGGVMRLLDEGRVSVHETTEEGERLLSLACSAGYYELAQVSHNPVDNIKLYEFNRFTLHSQMNVKRLLNHFLVDKLCVNISLLNPTINVFPPGSTRDARQRGGSASQPATSSR